MELSDIYSEKIIEIAARLSELPAIAEPSARARRRSRICGSTIEVALNLDNGVVTDYAHDVATCALGQTSAAVMADKIVGSTAEELRLVRAQMYAMLKDNGPPPSGKWEDLKYLEPVRSYPARHTSTLLVFDAVVDCLDQIEGTPSN